MESKAAREARLDYYKKWRAANKDKVKRYNRMYWERRAVAQEVNQGGERGQVGEK